MKSIKVVQVAVVFLLAVLAPASNVFSSMIEGSSEEAKTGNQEILRSAVRINGMLGKKVMLCTGSYVSENIILTARHCVEDNETGKAIFEHGSRILINDNFNYQVQDVIKQPSITKKEGRDVYSTDVALMLVKPVSSKGPMLNLPVAPVIGNGQLEQTSKRMLLAGFGLTHQKKDDAGELHAAYNFRRNPEEIYNAQPFQGVEQTPGKFPIQKSMISFFGPRNELTAVVSKAGTSLDEKKTAFGSFYPENSGIDLPGDSGGPVFAFDENGKAYVAGVASTTIFDMLNGPMKIAIQDADKKVVASFDVPTRTGLAIIDKFHTARLDRKIQRKLLELDFISTSKVAKKDFAVIIARARIAGGFYVSLSDEPNSTFVRDSIQKLEQERDQKPSEVRISAN